MPQTCIVWGESEDRSGADTNLAAVAGEELFTFSGDAMRLRKDLPNVSMVYAWTSSASYPVQSLKISGPSIANNPIYFNRGFAGSFSNTGIVYDYRNNPLQSLRTDDEYTVSGFETDQAGTAHTLALVLILSNTKVPISGPSQPITHQPRMTASGNTVAIGSGWQSRTLTEVSGEELPAGRYLMHGARVVSPTLIACRFIFKGLELRPAIIPANNSEDSHHSFSNFWGKSIGFTLPDGMPSIEMVASSAETPEHIELYLTKVS